VAPDPDIAAAANKRSMPGVDVLLVANVRLFRESLADAMERTGRVRVVALPSSYDEVVDELTSAPPDVVLLDIGLAELDRIVSFVLDSAELAKIAALGAGDPETEVLVCAEAGIHGYVDREATLEQLLASLEALVHDEMPCSPRIAAALMRALRTRVRAEGSSLTRRETEVLDLVAAGFSNKQIAARLHIELPTVKHHVHHILAKLNVRTRAEAIAQTNHARS
jgi:two-component system, NarL family, nitrate/nitrite response regulator NarL